MDDKSGTFWLVPAVVVVATFVVLIWGDIGAELAATISVVAGLTGFLVARGENTIDR